MLLGMGSVENPCHGPTAALMHPQGLAYHEVTSVFLSSSSPTCGHHLLIAMSRCPRACPQSLLVPVSHRMVLWLREDAARQSVVLSTALCPRTRSTTCAHQHPRACCIPSAS